MNSKVITTGAVIIAYLHLPACESVYNAKMPEGMKLVEHHYTDYQKLVIACNPAYGRAEHTEGCAYVDWDTCTIHLGLAGNGDPMHRDHEIRHCNGGVDAPKPVKDYFPY